jgi:hypothetical protein
MPTAERRIEQLEQRWTQPPPPASEAVARYYDAPAAFARECVDWRDGPGLASYQEQALAALVARRRVCWRGPHGLGKTALGALTVLWFALTRDATPMRGDWKVVCTASAWRQLARYFWPEVRKWARRLRWDEIGRPPFAGDELLALSLKLRHGEAFAVASSDEALIEGAHADRLLYVFDESKAIPDGIFDAAEGALSTGDAYALAVSTPGEPVGRFFAIQSRKPGYDDWDAAHITKADVLAAGRMSPEWAEARKRQWGEQSAVYQNRVEGDFAASESDGVIPLAWLEAANQRWLEWRDAGGKLDRLDAIGVDVARGGEDHSSLALRAGPVCVELRRETYAADTMALVGAVRGIQVAHGGKAIVDVIGVGGGPYDRLRELGADVDAFNAAEASHMTDRSGELGFLNRRAEVWWGLREQLDPATNPTIALPPDDQLTGDLTAPRWKVTSTAKIQIESKEDLRKAERLNRSTDDGDAVVMAWAALNRPRYESF